MPVGGGVICRPVIAERGLSGASHRENSGLFYFIIFLLQFLGGGNLFIIAPFSDHCLLVPFYFELSIRSTFSF